MTATLTSGDGAPRIQAKENCTTRFPATGISLSSIQMVNIEVCKLQSDALPERLPAGHSLKYAGWHIARDFDRIFLTDLDKGMGKVWQPSHNPWMIPSSQERRKTTAAGKYIRWMEKIHQQTDQPPDALPRSCYEVLPFYFQKVNIASSNQKEYFKVTSVGDKLGTGICQSKREWYQLCYVRPDIWSVRNQRDPFVRVTGWRCIWSG